MILNTFFVFVLSVLIIETIAQCDNLDDKLIGNICYQLNNKYVRQSDAWSSCSSQGYTLASIHSREQSGAIGDIARQAFSEIFELEYWIGLRNGQNGFHWDDNTPVDYFYWALGSPHEFDYVSVSVHNDQWHSSPDKQRFPYICTYHAKSSTTSQKPIPSTTNSTTTTSPITTQKTSVPSTTHSTITVTPTTTKTTASPTATSTTTSAPTTRSTTTSAPSTSLPKSGCQIGDINLDSRCYSFTRKKLSYTDARTQCEKIGKTLAIFDNFNQITFLSSYAQTAFDSSFTSFWIGLQRDSSSTSFYWQDGGALRFTNWSPGYPYDGERFVGQAISNTKWKTYSEGELLFSVCSGKVSFVQ